MGKTYLLNKTAKRSTNKEALCKMLKKLKSYNKYSCWTTCHNKKKKYKYAFSIKQSLISSGT